jgi:hypothetical protein
MGESQALKDLFFFQNKFGVWTLRFTLRLEQNLRLKNKNELH